MTEKDFINKVANSKVDFLQEVLDLLEKKNVPFCAIGGLAVNAYVEPVVSLDLDIVIAAEQLAVVVTELGQCYAVTKYPNSINIKSSASDLRIQIQTDTRYQPFIKRAIRKTVLGYDMPVATVEDVLKGKIWAAMDESRRPSKQQKDLSDIMRLVEAKKELISLIPDALRKKLF